MRVGVYDVESAIGAGGMSQVWLAHGPQGPVVLKRQLDPRDDVKLREEARVGLRLRHPCVVQTLDLVEHEGRPMLVLEYVQGASLVALRKRGPLDPAAVCRVGGDIAEGLAALHDAVDEHGRPLRILHRDVSPSNIIVSHDGRARLIDLGIARSSDATLDRTKTGDLKGTIRYLAPELFDNAQHTPKTDLWALGVCLFEASLGRPAFVGNEAAMLAAIVRGQLLTLRPGEALSQPVASVLAYLCAPAAQRFGDALEAVRALRDAERECGGDGQRLLARSVYAVAGADASALDVTQSMPPSPAMSTSPEDNPFARFTASTYCGVGDDDDLFPHTSPTPAVPAPVTVLSLPLIAPPSTPSSPGARPASHDSWDIPQPITGNPDASPAPPPSSFAPPPASSSSSSPSPSSPSPMPSPGPVAAPPPLSLPEPAAPIVGVPIAEALVDESEMRGSWIPLAAFVVVVLVLLAGAIVAMTHGGGTAAADAGAP